MPQQKTKIPEGWKELPLHDIFTVINGLWTGKTSDLVECKVLRNTNFLNNGKLNFADVALINVDRKSLLSRELVYGDIIIERSGGSDTQPVGRVINFKLRDKGYSFSNFTSCLRIIDQKSFDFKYIFLVLYNLWLTGVTEKMQKRTTGIRNLDFDAYLNFKVPMPGHSEQNKIAEILGAVDEEIEKAEKIIDETERLKSGLMQELFAKGIGHTKFKKIKIGNLPTSWELVKMKDICSVRQGLQIPISERYAEPAVKRYRYITIKNIKNNTYEYIESPKSSVICSKEDVLMTRTGNTGFVVSNVEGVFHNNFFLVDYDKTKISKDYLIYYFSLESIQKILLEKAGTTTIPDLNHGDFYAIHFILPPFTEQKEIAEILSAVDGKILIYKKIKDNHTQLKKGLMGDLLSGDVRVSC